MASVTAAVGRVKDELPQRISEALVNHACESAGHRWPVRVLAPVVVVRLFVLQVRLFMLDAAERQGVPTGRISFIDALDTVRHRDLLVAVALTLVVNALRPALHEARVIKRGTSRGGRKDRYSHMTKPREELRKTLGITKIAP